MTHWTACLKLHILREYYLFRGEHFMYRLCLLQSAESNLPSIKRQWSMYIYQLSSTKPTDVRIFSGAWVQNNCKKVNSPKLSAGGQHIWRGCLWWKSHLEKNAWNVFSLFPKKKSKGLMIIIYPKGACSRQCNKLKGRQTSTVVCGQFGIQSRFLRALRLGNRIHRRYMHNGSDRLKALYNI